MSIKSAQDAYFTKLETLYKKTFGTLPSVSWDPELDQSLFIGKPDEDGEICWKPKPAQGISLPGLGRELTEFFGSWYFWQMRGVYKGMAFDFAPQPCRKEAEKAALTALSDGRYYFPPRKAALLAVCSEKGNDDLLLFYDQEKEELFSYDRDKRFIYSLSFSLEELISSMEAVI